MALNVPTSHQWVAFTTSLNDSVVVEWKENWETKSRVYYVQNCYWGLVEGETEDQTIGSKVDPNGHRWISDNSEPPQVCRAIIKAIRGETKLFIPREYIEPGFRGGPMTSRHIRDLAKLERDQDAWVTLRLDQHVQYGQSGKDTSLKRWIVYHPSIHSSCPVPKIFQHRFYNSSSSQTISGAMDLVKSDILEQIPLIGGLLSSVYSSSMGAIRSVLGHYLHTFLDHEGVNEAKQLALKMVRGTPSIEDELLARQVIENLACIADNQDADKQIVQRVLDGAKEYESEKKLAEKEKHLSTRLLGNTTTSEKGISDEIGKASELLGKDGDHIMTQALIEKIDEESRDKIKTRLREGFTLGEKPGAGGLPRIRATEKPAIPLASGVAGQQAFRPNNKTNDEARHKSSTATSSMPNGHPSTIMTGLVKTRAEETQEQNVQDALKRGIRAQLSLISDLKEKRKQLESDTNTTWDRFVKLDRGRMNHVNNIVDSWQKVTKDTKAELREEMIRLDVWKEVEPGTR